MELDEFPLPALLEVPDWGSESDADETPAKPSRKRKAGDLEDHDAMQVYPGPGEEPSNAAGLVGSHSKKQ